MDTHILRGKASEHSGHRFTAALVAVWALLGISALLSACGGSSNSEEAQKVAKVYQRFDQALIRTFNRTDVIQSRAFACLSHAPPLGGPQLAKCEPVCEKALAELRRMRTHLGPVYRSSPRYLRRIFRRFHHALRHVLDVHVQTVDAMAEYARVHGASSYVGATEFERIKSGIAQGHAADRQEQKRLAQARRKWDRYAKRRWDLQYGPA
jgi:hypothetical protein